jgi:hypothetical protein
VKTQKLVVNIGVEMSEDIWATGEAINETKKIKHCVVRG